MRLAFALLALAAACGQRAPSPPPPPLEPEQRVVVPPRNPPGALTQAERDSLLREIAARREAWRARGISDYRIQVAVGCFCPWPSHPAILEVKRGVAVALRDTTGKSMGAPREPWSRYTVDGLFDAVEQGARYNDVIEVGYDPQYGYPAMIRGDGRVGLPDNWYWVRASRLTP
ncbi:MAG TPA: DUF6174 domain-containing protein [Gemmatimonadales bacterium]|nr:DUF6174 domain-containing protein [Gemmatimonadales bacterium]